MTAAAAAPATSLIAAGDDDYGWMLGGAPRYPNLELGLELPDGGVDAPEILKIVRQMARTAYAGGGSSSWMIVEGRTVVGVCSYKGGLGDDGEVEIGYGVAAAFQGRGHATRAVAALAEIAAADPALQALIAVTAVDNAASQRCLARNGFLEVGRAVDPEDGDVIRWRRVVSSTIIDDRM